MPRRPSPAFFVSADSKGVTRCLSVSADSKQLAGELVRPKLGKTLSSSVSADSAGLRGGRHMRRRNGGISEALLMPHPVFCAKSAEIQERKGVALRSGAKERAKRAKERGLGGAWQG